MVIPAAAALDSPAPGQAGIKKDIIADPETEICVAVAGMEALFCTVLTLVDEGDEVILPSPTYASYIEQILLAGVGWGYGLPSADSADHEGARSTVQIVRTCSGPKLGGKEKAAQAYIWVP
ncbi:MAG: aminotransferase class I/II-fold pyridoxal phosphate-dependent enzyme [Desulfobulbus sp.]